MFQGARGTRRNIAWTNPRLCINEQISLIDSARRNEYVRLEWVQHGKDGLDQLEREVLPFSHISRHLQPLPQHCEDYCFRVTLAVHLCCAAFRYLDRLRTAKDIAADLVAN